MKKLFVLLLSVLLLTSVGFAMACPPPKVTICHNGQTITISQAALAGHFDHDGQPAVGHENDYMGACVPETPTPPPECEGDCPPVLCEDCPPCLDCDTPEPVVYLFNIQWDGEVAVPSASLCYLDGSGCLIVDQPTEVVYIDGRPVWQVDFILVDVYNLEDLGAFYNGIPLPGWYRGGYGDWVLRP